MYLFGKAIFPQVEQSVQKSQVRRQSKQEKWVSVLSWRARAREDICGAQRGLRSHRRAGGMSLCASQMLFLPLTVQWHTG